MDVYLESLFVNELLMYGRFSLFQVIGFFAGFLSAVVSMEVVCCP